MLIELYHRINSSCSQKVGTEETREADPMVRVVCCGDSNCGSQAAVHESNKWGFNLLSMLQRPLYDVLLCGHCHATAALGKPHSYLFQKAYKSAIAAAPDIAIIIITGGPQPQP